ncbi:MAG TPA: ABC transporter ATP-binding protein [Catenuloplanes sp.]|jgi:putative ABC transport system ATP-binding protein
MTSTSSAVRAVGLTKWYGDGDARVVALAGVSLALPPGRFTAVMGPSGSGKSTFLHCVAGLDRPDAGQVFLGDTELTDLREPALTALRRDRIGFVFQAFNLLPTLTAVENITLPFDLAGRPVDTAALRRVVDAVGLGDRLHHRPAQLSGGQQQRVACARAMVTEPDVIFADEPTGALDSRASAEVLTVLRRSVDELDRSVVLVTHDPTAAAYADQVIFLADGRIVDRLIAPTAATVLGRMAALDTVAAR